MSEENLKSVADLVSHCTSRGFVFQSSEIYGGLGSCWDMGPLGVELKNNIKASWWKAMTFRDDIDGVDAAILMHPLVWKASLRFHPLFSVTGMLCIYHRQNPGSHL